MYGCGELGSVTAFAEDLREERELLGEMMVFPWSYFLREKMYSLEWRGKIND